MIEIAVVGGGPAGAYCAFNLAKNGYRVSVFDDSHPREKPCGGLISPQALKYFPFILGLPVQPRELLKAHFVSPRGMSIGFSARKIPYQAVSRLEFDKCLMEMASAEGANWVKEKVIHLERKENLWNITTPGSQSSAKIVVGADGHDSIVRRSIIGQSNRKDYGFTFGYFLSNLEKDEFIIAFMPHRRGYIWIIPRRNCTCAGICCTEVPLAEGLRRELDTFLSIKYPDLRKLSKWASLIPNVKEASTFNKPLAGKNWIIIGDAAGHVDPITGEGIMYALLDGDLAASAIIQNNPMSFDNMWREVFWRHLSVNIKARKIIYNRVALELYCAYQKIANQYNM
jgi:geranylgeranyl reductase family protein